jgi:hypothetical protein
MLMPVVMRALELAAANSWPANRAVKSLAARIHAGQAFPARMMRKLARLLTVARQCAVTASASTTSKLLKAVLKTALKIGPAVMGSVMQS